MSSNPTGARERAKERSQRIKAEMGGFGSLRDLERLVQHQLGKGTRGTSYGAVRAIVEGEVDHPRPDVVAAIANALAVPTAYLMDLAGPRRREAAAEDSDDDGLSHWVERSWAIDRGMADVPATWRWPSDSGAMGMLRRLVTDLLESGGQDLLSWPLADVEEAAELLTGVIMAPAEALGAGKSPLVGPAFGRGEDYFVAMTSALRAALPRRGTGHPEEILAALRAFRGARGAIVDVARRFAPPLGALGVDREGNARPAG